MSSGAASLEDGIKDTYSLEVKGGGVFYFKTIIDNLDDNSWQFEWDILFGLEERHVAGNPKQNRLRRVTAFFVEEGWFNGHEVPV